MTGRKLAIADRAPQAHGNVVRQVDRGNVSIGRARGIDDEPRNQSTRESAHAVP